MITNHSKLCGVILILFSQVALSSNPVADELQKSIHNNDADQVEVLIAQGADINQAILDDGSTPLILAAYLGRKKIVQILLENGADIDAKDNEDFTALSWSYIEKHDDTTDVLISSDANLEIKYQEKDPKGSLTPFKNVLLLHFASKDNNSQLIQKLIASGADVNVQTANGSPLGHGAGGGNIEYIKLFVQHGADVNLPASGLIWSKSAARRVFGINRRIETGGAIPLHGAVGNLQLDAVKLLVRLRSNLHAEASGVAHVGNKFVYYSRLTPLQLAEFNLKNKPLHKEEYSQIADYLRTYIQTQGSIDDVVHAIEDYARLLRSQNLLTEADKQDGYAKSLGATIGAKESVYLGFDPSKLLLEYSSALRNSNNISEADRIEELSAWYYHANFDAEISSAQKDKKEKDNNDTDTSWIDDY